MTATIEPKELPTATDTTHPCERWLYQMAKKKKITNETFWRFYHSNKSHYALFTASYVAELAAITKTDFWHLIKNVGFGVKVITVNEVLAYYKEKKTGYTLDVVATQE